MSKSKKARKSQAFSRIQHRMQGTTSLNDGHRHLFSNITDLLIRGVGTHRHTFRGITNTTEGHRHSYSGITGPAINGQGANHFHRFSVVTILADGHTHLISGRTTVPILIRGLSVHKLLVEKVKRIK